MKPIRVTCIGRTKYSPCSPTPPGFEVDDGDGSSAIWLCPSHLEEHKRKMLEDVAEFVGRHAQNHRILRSVEMLYDYDVKGIRRPEPEEVL